MFKITPRLTAGLALAALAHNAAAQLQCTDVEYSSVVTERFAQISDACRDVVVRDGSQFVRVRAGVVSVRRAARDASRVQQVTLKMLDAQDLPLRNIAFRPPRDFSFTVDGQAQTAEDLGRGQQLDIYIPSDRWEMVWDFETAVPFEERIFVEDVESISSVVTLSADEAFGFDSDQLSETGKAQLEEVIADVGDYVPLIEITGHADRVGAKAYNRDLSQRRAQAAKAYLVSLGVPENRVRAMGKGDSEPLVSCADAAPDELRSCLAPNRRAEVRFMIPLVAEGTTAVVTRRYRKPDGEIVTVNEYQDLITVNPASTLFGEVIDSCSADIERLCPDIPAGEGRILFCLYENSVDMSDGCADALAKASVDLSRREAQLNLIGDRCATDLAEHCADVPLYDKLSCLRDSALTQSCQDAVAQFKGIR